MPETNEITTHTANARQRLQMLKVSCSKSQQHIIESLLIDLQLIDNAVARTEGI